MGSLLLANAPSFSWFVAFALLLGAGTGLYYPVAASLLTDLFENTGQALGLHISGGDLSGLVVPVAAVAVAAQFDWRAGLLLGTAVAIPMLAVCTFSIRPTPPKHTRSSNPTTHSGSSGDFVHELWSTLTRPSIGYTVALATALGFTFQSVLSFFPTFLVEHWGASQAVAGGLFSVMFGVWIIFTPVAGRLSDAVGHDGVLAATVAGLATGVALVVAAPDSSAGLLGVVLVGVGMSWGGVIGSRFMMLFGEEERTTGYALVRSVYVLLGATGSIVVGALADGSGWPTAFGFLVVLLVLVLISLGVNRGLGLHL
jgi:MFS family permease